MKVCIIGSGSWGVALGKLLCENGNDVVIWSRNEEEVNSINLEHKIENKDHLLFLFMDHAAAAQMGNNKVSSVNRNDHSRCQPQRHPEI